MLPALVQLLAPAATFVALKTSKFRPGVFRKLHRNAPVTVLTESVRVVNVGTTLAGSKSSVVGPVSALLKPPATRTFPLGSRAVVCSLRPLVRGKVGDHFPVVGSYSSVEVGNIALKSP